MINLSQINYIFYIAIQSPNSNFDEAFHNYKNENIRSRLNVKHSKNDILNYILMFYNSKRLHSKFGYASPQQFENNYWGAITKAA